MVTTIHEIDYAHYELCDSGVYIREIVSMVFVGQVSGLVESFSTVIYSDIINLIISNFAWY